MQLQNEVKQWQKKTTMVAYCPMILFRPSMHPKRYIFITFALCTGKPPPPGLLCHWMSPWRPEPSFDMLGGIFVVHLTLIPHRTTFGKDGPITDTFLVRGDNFWQPKVVPLDRFWPWAKFFVTAQITSSSIPFLLIYLPPHKLGWGTEVLIAISLLVCVSCRWINFNN